MGGILSVEPKQGADGLSQLPDDVLWTILGFLDLPTLYTARLFCKRFRKSAAEHFKALDCTTLEKPPTTNFTQFLGMTHLAVTIPHDSPLLSRRHPRITPVVTHVTLKGFHLRNSIRAGQLQAALMRLPKLRSVSLEHVGGALHFPPLEGNLHLQPLEGNVHLPLFPPQLEELKITAPCHRSLYDMHWGGLGDVSHLTRYSQLTSLAIELVVGAGPSMGSLSSLHNLRSLDLHSCLSALALLSTFTALTSLTFKEKRIWGFSPNFQDLGRLTGLSRLALIQTSKIVGLADLTCIAQLTKLTCLDMSGCELHDSAVRSTALAPLTRLLAVSFSGEKAGALVSSLRVNTLHSLTLWRISDISVLQRATRLAHPDLHCRIPMYCSSLPGCPAVAGMLKLRSLSLSVHSYQGPSFQLDAILRVCTMLTKLDYKGWIFRPKRDLRACAALPGLRSLKFERIPELTPAWLPALQAMSGLTELSLLDTGISVADVTPAVIAAFDAERYQLGWPLIKLRVQYRREEKCFEHV